ncbi:DUF2147 domain-containing protein [Echinicola jeungdonensis]|uniref:DUF2147 domain-containing protein n=1 Tax=Echinicola jeungdonensis TaxID=709343 RepID=A0ABV5J7N9_9BACT|nr:DUF2147 domain-containing protein [Echinicola jeungdonensis]MDN3670943.1 DUF2147 domain-containing protein [Echinicola jeungdonensis]
MHLIIKLIFILTGLSNDPPADFILGSWYTEEKAALIGFSKNEQGYFGEIIWLKDSLKSGKTKVDENNKNPNLRKRPILGIPIVWGLKYEDGNWEGGKLYDPQSGSTYNCQIKVKDTLTIEVRGYLGLPAFGRSVYWTKVEK